MCGGTRCCAVECARESLYAWERHGDEQPNLGSVFVFAIGLFMVQYVM